MNKKRYKERDNGKKNVERRRREGVRGEGNKIRRREKRQERGGKRRIEKVECSGSEKKKRKGGRETRKETKKKKESRIIIKINENKNKVSENTSALRKKEKRRKI